MTLDQLRIFIAVAEREHLTRAAEALNLTQSAVSSAIASLEGRYDTRLFDRVGRGLRLTEAGRAFLPEARAVLARTHAAEQTLHDVATGLRGSLHVAASQTVGNFWLPERLARFHQAWPGVALRLSIDNTAEAIGRVLAGEADIGVVEGTVEDARLHVQPLSGDDLVLIAPNGLALPTPPDWAALRFCVREKGSGTRHILAAHLDGMGLKLDANNIVMELPSNEAVRGAVEAGMGVSLQSRLVAQRAVQAGLIQAVDIGLPPRPFHLVRLKERAATRVETAFTEVCGAE